MDKNTIAGVLVVCCIVLVCAGPPVYWVWQRRKRERIERTGDLVQAVVLRSRSVWHRDAQPDFKLLLAVPQRDGTTREVRLTATFRGTMALPSEGSMVWVVVDPADPSVVFLADRDAWHRGRPA